MKKLILITLISFLLMGLSGPTNVELVQAQNNGETGIEEQSRNNVLTFWFVFVERDSQQIVISCVGTKPIGGDVWLGIPQTGFYTDVTIRITNTAKSDPLVNSVVIYEKGDMTLETFRTNILLPMVDLLGIPKVFSQPLMPNIYDRSDEEFWSK
jgi:hypothetical protein